MNLLTGFKWILSPFTMSESATLYLGGGDDKPDYIPIKPANVTSGFGTAIADAEKGKYSYTLDPRLAQMRDIFYGATGQFLPTEQQNMFNRSMIDQATSTYGTGSDFLNQALGMSPQQQGQQYYSDIQALQAPNRAVENAQLADTLFKTGRSGAATSFNANGYLNPQQYALLQSRAQADKALAIDAENLGRARQQQDINTATGLQQSGLNAYNAGQALRTQPYAQANSIFGLGTGIEQLGQVPMSTAMTALNAQLAQQAQAQAYENATVDSGKGGLGGALGTVGAIAGSAFGGPAGGAIGGAIGTTLGGGQVNPLSLATNLAGTNFANDIGNWASSIWSSPSYANLTGLGNNMVQYGSGYSSLLGGNTIAPNYQLSPYN